MLQLRRRAALSLLFSLCLPFLDAEEGSWSLDPLQVPAGCSGVWGQGPADDDTLLACCAALDEALMAVFEQHLYENEEDEETIWLDRQSCLAKRRELEERCQRHAHERKWAPESCTREPGTHWGNLPTATMQDELLIIRCACFTA